MPASPRRRHSWRPSERCAGEMSAYDPVVVGEPSCRIGYHVARNGFSWVGHHDDLSDATRRRML